MDDLRAAQQWMLDAILHNRNTAHAPALLRHSVTLAATDRLAIYSRGYAARLLECLRASFPLLRELTGDQVFDLFAYAYIRAHPPAGYSLADYGKNFPDFLDATQPADATEITALPAAVARLDHLAHTR